MALFRSRAPRSTTPIVATILVVDDDLIVGRSLCRALQALRPDFRVEFAISGEAALSMLAASRYDVVVTDLEMGRVSGADLLRILARDYPAVRRIVHSSHTEASQMHDLRQMGHAALEKPARPGELLEAVEMVLKG
jgi:DNA-binding NarL/FixJ family response regulator